MRLIRSVSVLAFVAALGMSASVSGAQAGFEWVAPKEDMTGSLQLPTPKPGTPRISADPMNQGLDPLPPLSVDQEGGTRSTVYSSAPQPVPMAADSLLAAPRRAPPPMVSEEAPRESLRAQPQMKTLDFGQDGSEPRMAGQVSPPVYENFDRPRQLRMADKLEVPDDVDLAPAHEGGPMPVAEGRVAINPAPALPPPSYAPAPAPAMEASIPNAPVLEGFGSDLPLAMALQQVVPPDYTYSFASGVNPGEAVSWEGGKAWTQVLSEMLNGQGLKATIRGRSIQIQSADSMMAPRADAGKDASEQVAAALSETAPAAGETVEKVEAVPPVYPPEVFANKGAGEPRVLGSISENQGLRVEDVQETVQIQGSPEAAQKARKDINDHAVGLKGDNPEAANLAPQAEITSFAVTTKTKKVSEAAAPRRVNITDPGEQPARQPDVQSLNTKADKPAEPRQLAAAQIPASPKTPPSLIPPGAGEQRKKLEDMARQQGIVLDAKNYNDDALGKIFNNGLAPAAGDEPVSAKAAPRAEAPGSLPAPASLPPPAASLPAPDVGLEQKPAAPAVAEKQVTKAAEAPAPAKALVEAAPAEETSQPTVSAEAPAPPAAKAPTSPVDQPIRRIRATGSSAQDQAAATAAAGGANFWEASKGDDLKETLTQWSKNAGGMRLVWNAKSDYKLGANMMVYGSFNDAMKALFAEAGKSVSFPVMRFTDDGAGKSVLVVDDKSS